MKVTTYNIKGTQINKMQFSEIEYYLQEKGLNVDEVFNKISDENEFVYVSNGFVRGLETVENEEGEWHHYFKKEIDGTFKAGKLFFN